MWPFKKHLTTKDEENKPEITSVLLSKNEKAPPNLDLSSYVPKDCKCAKCKPSQKYTERYIQERIRHINYHLQKYFKDSGMTIDIEVTSNGYSSVFDKQIHYSINKIRTYLTGTTAWSTFSLPQHHTEMTYLQEVCVPPLGTYINDDFLLSDKFFCWFYEKQLPKKNYFLEETI